MASYVRHEERIGEIRLRIIAEEDPSNPRTDFDHPGTILCCDHRRHALGDEDAHAGVAALVRASPDYRAGWEEERGRALNFSEGPDLWAAVQRCRDIIALPCYLYDHSGITMATRPFSCPWDSGQVGFICIGKGAILEAFLKPAGGCLTAGLKEKARRLLRAEVEEYDMYLTGDVWGYVVDRADGSDLPDHDDRSCWGVFGYDHAEAEGREALGQVAALYPGLTEQA